MAESAELSRGIGVKSRLATGWIADDGRGYESCKQCTKHGPNEGLQATATSEAFGEAGASRFGGRA